jgi:hypothetical protein
LKKKENNFCPRDLASFVPEAYAMTCDDHAARIFFFKDANLKGKFLAD